MNVQVIVGPPGTGKTETLVNQLNAVVSSGIDPKRVAMVAFTRAAKAELLGRIGSRLGIAEDDLPWLKTIHGMAFKLLGGATGNVMDAREWRAFAAECGYNLTGAGCDDGAGLPRRTGDDDKRAVYEWGRACGLTVDEMLKKTPIVTVEPSGLRRYVEAYLRFKAGNGIVDFTDMIEEAIASGKRPKVDVAFVDEAQDLSPLQIRAVETWFGGCADLYVAGDDDQTIFQFQGAAPGWLQQLGVTHGATILQTSNRVPRAVHAVAQRIITQNKNRLPKSYQPRNAEGSVERVGLDVAIRGLDPSVETFVLARNRFYLRAAAKMLDELGMPYLVEGSGGSGGMYDGNNRMVVAVRTALNLARGGFVEAQDLLKVLDYVPVAIAAPLRAALETKSETIFTIDVLQGEFIDRLRAGGPVEALSLLPRVTLEKMVSILQRHHGLTDAKIRLTTIHGAKGRQAEVVVLIPDMSKATYAEYLDVRHGGNEAEARVAYVGVTRAREKLILTLPTTRKYFVYPR